MEIIKQGRFLTFPSFYSPMMVKLNDEATALNLVCVVEPVGTYTVLVVPDLLVTKFVTVDTFGEPI